MGNPYNKMINLIKKTGAAYNPPSIMIGEVIMDEPLTIRIGELEITKENILVADYLMKGYTRTNKQEEITCSMYKKVFETIPKSYDHDYSLEGANSGGPVKIVGTNPLNKMEIKLNSSWSEEELFENDSKITLTDGLKTEDLVAVMPTYDMQKYLVLARILEI